MTILANIKKVFDQSEDVFEKEIRKIRTKKLGIKLKQKLKRKN
jgi:hypothetical protein